MTSLTIAHSPQSVIAFCSRHKRLVTSVTQLALYTVVFLGRVYKEIPPGVTNGAYTLLSFSVLPHIKDMVTDAQKKGSDVSYAIRDGQWQEIAFCSCKFALSVVNLALSVASVAASFFLFVGASPIALPMWACMYPFSLAALGGGLLTKGIDYFYNHSLLQDVKVLDAREKREVVSIFYCYVQNLPIASCSKTNQIRARHFYQQMSVYYSKEIQNTWDVSFRQQDHVIDASNRDIDIYLRGITEPIENSLQYITEQFALFLFGQVCITVGKIYPRTVYSSFAYWLSSAVYTGTMISDALRKENYSAGRSPQEESAAFSGGSLEGISEPAQN